jgi:hypothetical protein
VVWVDPHVRRYNDLNAAMAAMLPATATAYDTVSRSPEQIEAKRAIAANLNRARQQRPKTDPESRLWREDEVNHNKSA